MERSFTISRKEPQAERQVHPLVLWTLGAAYIALLSVPCIVFFSSRGGLALLQASQGRDTAFLLFPLVGLYAFFLLWIQFLLGSNMYWLRPALPALYRFHKAQGGFVLLFAFLHPTLLLIGVGGTSLWHSSFVPPSQRFFVELGYIQLIIISATAGAALLRHLPWLKNHWHYIHYLNYVLFLSVWVHSWNLGTDTHEPFLRASWVFFGLTAVLSLLARVFFAKRPKGSGR